MKVGQNVCLDEVFDVFEMLHVGFKTRSLGQILKKKLVYALETSFFGPMLIKLGQNAFFDEISDDLENGSCWVKN